MECVNVQGAWRLEERKEMLEVTKEDIAGYLRVLNDYSDVDVLLALAIGDFKDMPFRYLERILISIVPEDRNQIRGSQKHIKGVKVSEVYDAIGIENVHIRIEELALESARKVGKETAKNMLYENTAVGRRLPIQILGDIKYVAERFYQDSQDRKNLLYTSIREFKKECYKELGEEGTREFQKIIEHVESVVKGTYGNYNMP